MRRPAAFGAALLALLLCAACSELALHDAEDTAFTESERYRVQSAQVLAQHVVFDPLFVASLRALRLGDLDCSPCRYASAPRPTGENLWRALELRGLFSSEQIGGKRASWAVDLPLAITDPCGERTWLNVDQLGRDPQSIANTLIHERLHAFCYVHAQPTRELAYCDPAYAAGDLAEAVLRFRDLQDGRSSRLLPVYGAPRLCPSVCRALEANGVETSRAQCRTRTSG